MYPSAEDVVDGDNEGIKSVHEVLLSVVAAQMQGGGKKPAGGDGFLRANCTLYNGILGTYVTQCANSSRNYDTKATCSPAFTFAT